jgi:hypothetical protein
MIDQPHGCFTRNASAAQPIDVGDAQTVKTQMRHLDFDEELLPPSRWLEWEFNGEPPVRVADELEPRT